MDFYLCVSLCVIFVVFFRTISDMRDINMMFLEWMREISNLQNRVDRLEIESRYKDGNRNSNTPQ
jgi:hypothetical protein